MKKEFIQYLNSELNVALSSLIEVFPKSKSSEIQKIFDKLSTNINSVFCREYVYLRDAQGKVQRFKELGEVATITQKSIFTLDKYLTSRGGTANFSGWTLSIFPLDELEIIPIKIIYWVRTTEGKVLQFFDLDEAAKFLRIKTQSLYCYLSNGKGKAQTKCGIVSTSPLTELTPDEAYQQQFYSKHGRWPEDHELPVKKPFAHLLKS